MSRPPTIVHPRREQPIDLDTGDIPDRVTVDLDDKDPNAFIIDEVDDTPEKDRGRPTKVDNPTEVTEDELRAYGGRASDRIRQLDFERNTERRGRNDAERIATEATAHARRLIAENAQLKRASDTATTALSGSMIKEREAALGTARNELAAAHDSGDGEAIAKATEKVSTLAAEMTFIRAQAPRPVEKAADGGGERQPVQTEERREAPTMAPNVAKWVAGNSDWFAKPGHEEKTAVAYTIHNKLINDGVQPASPDYTRKLDEGLKKVFVDHEPLEKRNSPTRDEPAPRRDVVGSGSRQAPAGGSPPPRTVQLTASQVRLANNLGISVQAYAASYLKDQERKQSKESAR